MSNTKTTYLRAFNKHFFEFLDDVISIYPENDEIKNARNSFQMVQSTSVAAIIKVWYKFVYIPYKEVIEQGDITFFFEKDYSSDISHLSNSNEILKIIDKVREPIRTMDETNKKHSCDYLANLCKLSELYSNN